MTSVIGQTVAPINKPIELPAGKSSIAKSSVYLEDLSRMAAEGQIQFTVGLDAEVLKVGRALASSNRAGTILVDKYGSKHLAVVQNLAQSLTAENAPAGLRQKRILKINLGQILADSRSQEEVFAKLQNVLKVVESGGDKSILYVEDLSSFAAQNQTFGAQVAAELRKSLTNGKIQVISAGTSEDYTAQIALDNQIKNRFRAIDISDIEGNETADGFVGDKISPDLRELINGKNADEKVSVILQSDDIKNPALLAVLDKNGVSVKNEVKSLNMLEVELPASAAQDVANARGAKHLSLNRSVDSLGHIETTTGLTAMRAQSGNSGLNGTGIGIAVVDSGVYEGHKSFLEKSLTGALLSTDRVIKTTDFTGEARTANTDPYGHGAHVAGIAAGTDGSPDLASYVGVANNAKVINVRVLNSNGSGTSAALLQGN